MDAGKIGQSLKRKLGPLPVWAWALIGGIALYLYRARTAGGASGGASPSAAQTQAEAQLIAARGAAQQTPQAPTIVAPGERVYDPNSGVFLGGSGGNQQQTALIDLIAALMLQKKHHHHTKKRHHHHNRASRHLRKDRINPRRYKMVTAKSHKHGAGKKK